MDNDYHHLLACKLEDVKTFLHKQDSNKEIITQETSPPNSEIYEGQKRVINIRKKNPETISVIWCYENYS